jgi:hypothetical protein
MILVARRHASMNGRMGLVVGKVSSLNRGISLVTRRQSDPRERTSLAVENNSSLGVKGFGGGDRFQSVSEWAWCG